MQITVKNNRTVKQIAMPLFAVLLFALLALSAPSAAAIDASNITYDQSSETFFGAAYISYDGKTFKSTPKGSVTVSQYLSSSKEYFIWINDSASAEGALKYGFLPRQRTPVASIVKVALDIETDTVTVEGEYEYRTNKPAEPVGAEGQQYIKSSVTSKHQIPIGDKSTAVFIRTPGTAVVKTGVFSDCERVFLPASLDMTLRLPAKNSPPGVSYNNETTNIKGALPGMLFAVYSERGGDISWEKITDANMEDGEFSLVLNEDPLYVAFRNPASDGKRVSDLTEIYIPPASPGIALASKTDIMVKIESDAELITGVNANMEFLAVTNGIPADKWQSVTGTEIYIAGLISNNADEVLLRYKAATGKNPTRPGEAISVPVKRGAAPAVSFDTDNERLNYSIATITDLQFSADNTNWTELSSADQLVPFIPKFSAAGEERKVYIRLGPTFLSIGSRSAAITLKSRPATPALPIISDADEIVTIDEDSAAGKLQFKYYKTDDLEPVNWQYLKGIHCKLEDNEQASLTLLIRVAPADGKPASLAQQITLKRAAAPVITVQNGKYTGTNTAMEYRIEGGNWTQVPASMPAISGTVEFRTAATAKKPASLIFTYSPGA